MANTNLLSGGSVKHGYKSCLLFLMCMTMFGCGDGGGEEVSSNNPPPTEPPSTEPPPAIIDTDVVLMTVTAMQEPRITLNIPWSTQEAESEGIPITITPKGGTYTVWKSDYDEKLAKCHSFGNAKVGLEEICVPENTSCTAGSSLPYVPEYGYFCGAGRPGGAFTVNEPLDGIDYCCYLHDQNIWDPIDPQTAESVSNNACGMALCVRQMSEYPAGAANQFPNVEGYRQCIYDWATISTGGCAGNQTNDPLLPFVMINPN